MIGENIRRVEREIADACGRAGRKREDVTLIAVSKTKPLSMLRKAYEAGIRDFGENRVQELMEKMPMMPEDVRWHMIGHLQRNKVKYVVGRVHLIHGVDSLALAEAISREALKQKTQADILLEVNVAGEESKFGVSEAGAFALVSEAAKLPGIRIRGLMTIAPLAEDPEANRIYFQRLRQLSVDIMRKNPDNVCMDILSMGMTGDYVAAVEEGAVCVRVGTGIFGERHGAADMQNPQ